MSRFFHILAQILGIGAVATGQLTDALPQGKAKNAVVVAGVVIAAVSSFQKAFVPAKATTP